MKSEKLVRFYSDGQQQKGSQVENPLAGHKFGPSVLNADTLKFGGPKVFPKDHEPWHKNILDPGSEIVLNWNRVFIVTCLLALFIDPLYFYLPSIGGSQGSWCAKTDVKLQIAVTFFRTIADLFYLLHVVIKFMIAYVAPSSRIFGRGQLLMDPQKIARRYIRIDFFIDLIATLPLPLPQAKNGKHSPSAQRLQDTWLIWPPDLLSTETPASPSYWGSLRCQPLPGPGSQLHTLPLRYLWAFRRHLFPRLLSGRKARLATRSTLCGSFDIV